MKSKIIMFLSVLILMMTVAAAATGLFYQGVDQPFEFTTLRGQKSQIYGQGLYRFDTRFFGAGFKGQDAVALFLGVPVLLLSIVLFQKGSLTGHLLLTGVLGYFLYLYASMALGTAYNPLFLLYIALFSTSLFAFISAFYSGYSRLSALRGLENLSAKGLAIFMFLAGAITLFVWGEPLIKALVNHTAPDRMDSYTTMVTYALDLGIITPATIICAILLLKKHPLGYLLTMPLLTLIILLAPQILLSTIFQYQAGVPFTKAEMIGPVGGFVVLGLFAIWLLITNIKKIQNLI